MAFLYLNSKGDPWYKHSYSAGSDFDSSPLKYKLRRIDGWKEKDTKASQKFGRALESAIQFYHENNGEGGIQEFLRLWAANKDDKALVYTKTESSWESLNRAGKEMMVLYKIRQPSLPIPLASAFQREFEKEVFPEHPELGGIRHAGKLDILVRTEPDHAFLPRIQWNEAWGAFRTLIVDIKTSALDFDERPGMCAFDSQLRNYSWLTGYRDVAFLWFKKAGHNLQKGSSITFLTDSAKFKAGDEAVVAQMVGEQAYVVRNDEQIEEMEKAQGRKREATDKPEDEPTGDLMTDKAAKERKAIWLQANADLVDTDVLTRQRLQFNAGIVRPEYAEDAGFVVGRQITGIVNCWKQNHWPMEFGVRFPRDNRNDSYFKAFVMKDEMFKNQFFVKSDDTFDDLLVSDDDPEEA